MRDYENLADTPFYLTDLAKALPDGAADASDEPEPPWIFEGIASDESTDEDGDTILRKALDLSYASSRGFVNWDHSSRAGDQIGYIQEISLLDKTRVKTFEEKLGITLSKSASVFVRGELYKYVQAAEEVANLLKSAPPGKGVGLSLQGALARDRESGDVMKAFVRGVAITPVPAHPRTLATLVKSLREGPSAADPPGSSVAESLRTYVDDRIEELRRSLAQEPEKMTFDEACLWVLRRQPKLPYEAAETVVRSTLKES